jgi:hypothetical protein
VTLVGLALGELLLNEPQDFMVAQWGDRFTKHLQATHQLQLKATWNAQKGKGPKQQPVKVGKCVALKATPFKTAIRSNKPDPSIVVSCNTNSGSD